MTNNSWPDAILHHQPFGVGINGRHAGGGDGIPLLYLGGDFLILREKLGEQILFPEEAVAGEDGNVAVRHHSGGNSFTTFIVSKLTVMTWPMRRTIYSSSSIRFGSLARLPCSSRAARPAWFWPGAAVAANLRCAFGSISDVSSRRDWKDQRASALMDAPARPRACPASRAM